MKQELQKDDLLDILLDSENKAPIVLMDENGRQMRFEQVAVIPHKDNGDIRLYTVLKPLDKIEGIKDDEAIVFLVDTDDEGNSIIRIEEDEKVCNDVFNKYVDLLYDAEKAKLEEELNKLRPKTEK